MHSVPLEGRRPAAVRRAYALTMEKALRRNDHMRILSREEAMRRKRRGEERRGRGEERRGEERRGEERRGEERRGEAACTRRTCSPRKGKATTTSKELEESRPHGGRVSTRTFPSYPSTSTTVHLNRVTRCWGARGEREATEMKGGKGGECLWEEEEEEIHFGGEHLRGKRIFCQTEHELNDELMRVGLLGAGFQQGFRESNYRRLSKIKYIRRRIRDREEAIK